MGNLFALRVAFLQQWAEANRIATNLPNLINAVPIVALLAWITKSSGRLDAFGYIVVGAFFMVIWTNCISRMAWALESELYQGTLELNLASRTPVFVPIVGKSVALIVSNIIPGLVASLTAVLVTQSFVDVANLPLTLISACFSLVAIFSACFVFAPLYMLVGARAGFFSALQPLGVVLGGFFFPVSSLPAFLQPSVLSRN